MDVIGDSTLAFHAYLEQENENTAILYLVIHGLFQTISQSLSACQQLFKAVKVEPRALLKDTAKLLKNYRNIISGHPDGFLDKRKKHGTSGISRVTLSKMGFTLAQWFDDGTYDLKPFDIVLYLSTSIRVVNALLRQLVLELKRRESLFAVEWSSSPLINHVQQFLYFAEKIGESVRHSGGLPLSFSVELVESGCSKLTLDKRLGLDSCKAVSSVMVDIEKVISLLKTSDFYAGANVLASVQDAINAEYLQLKVAELLTVISDVDSHYVQLYDLLALRLVDLSANTNGT